MKKEVIEGWGDIKITLDMKKEVIEEWGRYKNNIWQEKRSVSSHV